MHRAAFGGEGKATCIKRVNQGRACEDPRAHTSKEPLVLANRCQQCETEEADSCNNTSSYIWGRVAFSLGDGTLLGKSDDSLERMRVST